MKRLLIVNADDFGLSAGINRGIIECFEHGIVTSASLMVRWPTAGEAAAYMKLHSRLSLGLHVDLGEWILRKGGWTALYRVVDTHNAAAVELEIHRQVAEFQRLTGRDPTHLDSHQHAHQSEPARSVLLKLAADLHVPLRGLDSRVKYCGDFYGQDEDGRSHPELLTVENLKNVLRNSKNDITELGCHPGYSDGLDSPYCGERNKELKVLCQPEAREAVEALGFQLCSFGPSTSPA